MKLIINADDYGLTEGVSKGIIKAMKEGIVTDTTAMTNMPYFKTAIKEALDNGINEMGIHLVLTCGKPILGKDQVPSLVDEDGCFYRKPQIAIKHMAIEDIEKELRAQIKTFLDTEMKLNHIDFHHHTFAFRDDIYNLVMDLANELQVPIRCPFENTKILIGNKVRHPEAFSYSFFEETVSIENLIQIIEENKLAKELEIMCHPAIIDEEIMRISSYNTYRKKELDVLTSKEIKEYLENNNIELISFSRL